MISSTVSDMMNQTLISIHKEIPECWLVVNRHDGAEIAFPESILVSKSSSTLRRLVERTWELWGRPFSCPASWAKVTSDGQVVKV